MQSMGQNDWRLRMMAETGDVLFTRGTSWLNRLSCWATGPASHQATVYDPRHIVDATIKKGVKQSSLQSFFDAAKEEKTEWIIFHWLKDFNNHERIKMQLDMQEAMTFEEYSILELPLQFIDSIINKFRRKPRQGYDAYVFRRLGGIWQNGVICSKTSNRVLIRAGLIPQESGLEYASPADTYRYLMRSMDCVVLQNSPGWFDYPGAKKDEIARAGLPGLLGRYPWRV
jgi:hypothetical protein